MKLPERFLSGLTAPLSLIGASIAVLLLASPALASTEFSGQVGNANTGEALAGANVILTGQRNFSAITGRDGTFAISDLPAGTYNVRVSYTGLDDQTESVDLVDGQPTNATFRLTAAIYKLDPMVVAGVREGNAAALTEQHNADQIMNSVSTDAFGDVADGNIGNMLIRLPGVEGIQEVGDVVGISVRGMPPDLNSVEVDGIRSASPASEIYTSAGDMGDRAVPIDQLPSDFIKEVQVIKVITPDMPPDSIGGAVNMITKSPLDVDQDLLTYHFGTSLNTYRVEQRAWRPDGAITFLGKLSPKLGVAVSASYTETANPRDRIQMVRNYVLNYTSEARTLNDWNNRTRSGANIKFDYQLSDNVRLTFGADYIYYALNYVRNDWNITANSGIADYSVVSLAQIEAGTTPKTTAGATAGIAPNPTPRFTELLNATFSDIGGDGQRHTRTYDYSAAADIKLPADQHLTLRASYSPGWFSTDFQTVTATMTGGFGETVDSTANLYRPVYTQAYGPTIGFGTNWSAYKASRTDSYNRNTDSIVDASADYEKKFDPIGPVAITFKSGFDFRAEHRSQAPWSPTWTYTGNNIGQFAQAQPGYGVFNNLYPQRDTLDWASFMRFFNATPGQFTPGAAVAAGPQYSQLLEDVGAIYLMPTAKAGPFTLIGGVRVEQTDLDTTGLNSNPLTPTLTSVSATGEYKNYFPSVLLNYEPIHNLVFRTSYSTTEARPSYTSLYPDTVVTPNSESGLGTISVTNPALRPEYSRNWDASVEYYSRVAGVISANWFYKDISDYLYTETNIVGSGQNNGFDGQYAGYTETLDANGGGAEAKGYELNFMRQLTELPAPFNSWGVTANYTSMVTSGNYGTGTNQLLRFIPRSSNVGVVGGYKAFEARISYNMKGGYLYSYSTTPYDSVWTSGVHTWDLNLKYKVSSRLIFYADAVNLFNKWESWYTGSDPTRVTMAEVYGTRFNTGISGRW